MNKEFIGKIEGKEEKVGSKGTFYKLKVGNLTFNDFEGVAVNVSLNDNIKVIYSESQGTFNGKPVTYKNVVSIEKTIESPAQTVRNEVIDKVKIRSLAVSYAKDLLVANEIGKHDLLIVADTLATYIETGKLIAQEEEVEHEKV